MNVASREKGNNHGGNQGGLPVAQENENHQNRQGNGQPEGINSRLGCLADVVSLGSSQFQGQVWEIWGQVGPLHPPLAAPLPGYWRCPASPPEWPGHLRR